MFQSVTFHPNVFKFRRNPLLLSYLHSPEVPARHPSSGLCVTLPRPRAALRGLRRSGRVSGPSAVHVGAQESQATPSKWLYTLPGPKTAPCTLSRAGRLPATGDRACEPGQRHTDERLPMAEPHAGRPPLLLSRPSRAMGGFSGVIAHPTPGESETVLAPSPWRISFVHEPASFLQRASSSSGSYDDSNSEMEYRCQGHY